MNREYFAQLLKEQYPGNVVFDDFVKSKEDYVQIYLKYFDNKCFYLANKEDFWRQISKETKLQSEIFNLTIPENEMFELVKKYVLVDGNTVYLLHFKNEEDVVNYFINMLLNPSMAEHG